MNIVDQPDGLEGYVVPVEEEDLKRPIDLPELKGEWMEIINRCEGVAKKSGLFQAVYLTNNEFAIHPESLFYFVLRSISGPYMKI